jgi:hypothetical protein
MCIGPWRIMGQYMRIPTPNRDYRSRECFTSVVVRQGDVALARDNGVKAKVLLNAALQ